MDGRFLQTNGELCGETSLLGSEGDNTRSTSGRIGFAQEKRFLVLGYRSV